MKYLEHASRNYFIHTLYERSKEYSRPFSKKALNEFYNYIIRCEKNDNFEWVLDERTLADICNDYTQYDNFEEIQDDYDFLKITSIADLADMTEVVYVGSEGILIHEILA